MSLLASSSDPTPAPAPAPTPPGRSLADIDRDIQSHREVIHGMRDDKRLAALEGFYKEKIAVLKASGELPEGVRSFAAEHGEPEAGNSDAETRQIRNELTNVYSPTIVEDISEALIGDGRPFADGAALDRLAAEVGILGGERSEAAHLLCSAMKDTGVNIPAPQTTDRVEQSLQSLWKDRYSENLKLAEAGAVKVFGSVEKAENFMTAYRITRDPQRQVAAIRLLAHVGRGK